MRHRGSRRGNRATPSSRRPGLARPAPGAHGGPWSADLSGPQPSQAIQRREGVRGKRCTGPRKETDKQTRHVGVMRAGRQPGQSGRGWGAARDAGGRGGALGAWGRGAAHSGMLTGLLSATPPCPQTPLFTQRFTCGPPSPWPPWVNCLPEMNRRQTSLQTSNVCPASQEPFFSLFHPEGKRPHIAD